MVLNVIDDNFRKEVLEFSNNKKVIVDFYAKWCMPCKMMNPFFEKIESEYSILKFVKVDIDHNPKISLKYDINDVPLIAVFENEKISKSFTGYKSASDIRKWIDTNFKN